MSNFIQGVFSDAQAITNTAVLSTNYIDLGSKGDAIGNELYLDIDIAEAFAGGTSLLIELVTDDEATFTGAKVLSSFNLLTADLTLNKRISVGRLPLGSNKLLSMKYTPTGTFTAGKINSRLTFGTDYQII